MFKRRPLARTTLGHGVGETRDVRQADITLDDHGLALFPR